MNSRTLSASPLFRFLCVLLAVVMATAPSASVIAQTNAAQQAVRQRVQGLGRPEQPQPNSEDSHGYAGYDTAPVEPAAGAIDTTFVTPEACALIVFRPAQIMAAPMAQLLPIEVASAAGLQYLGFDPADIEEAIAFVDMSDPAALQYGATMKFNKPIRGSDIAPHARPYAQLGELAGRKYLQSSHPMWPSFYGPNSRTLVVAPDATLRRIVETGGEGGPLLDRARTVPAGSDLYATVDFDSLRPLIMMGMAQLQPNIPPDGQQFLEAPNLIRAVELTFNFSKAGPTSLAVHGNDETAAHQLETMVAEATKKYQAATQVEAAASDDPVQRAMAQYRERILKPFQPQRNGASLILFHIDGQNPAEQQLASVAVMGILGALLLPALQAARDAAQRTENVDAPPAGAPEQEAIDLRR